MCLSRDIESTTLLVLFYEYLIKVCRGTFLVTGFTIAAFERLVDRELHTLFIGALLCLLRI